MSLPALKKTRSENVDVRRLEDAVDDVVRPLSSNPLLDGRLIEGVAITSGTTKLVDHGLGRAWRGWYVVDRNANANVYRDTASRAEASRQLALLASATVTVTLWVF